MKHKDTGRSMVEMLAVLALIAILSIAALAGYAYAVAKGAANDLLDELNKRVVVASVQKMRGIIEFDMDEFGDKTKNGYPVQTYVLPYDKRFFALKVQQVPIRVCEIFLRDNWQLPSQIIIGSEIFNGDESLCRLAESDMAPDMEFIFFEGLDASAQPPIPCRGSAECGPCESCIEYLCQNPNNLVYYHGQCLTGTPCQDGAVWNEKENMCECADGVYVNGACVPAADCPTDAKWDASIQQCICKDAMKSYDEVLKECRDNPCKEGEYISYFWNGTQQYEQCCPIGRKAAYIDENGNEGRVCCPLGYDAVTPPRSWGGYTFKQTVCVRSMCESGYLKQFYRGGEYLPICCDDENVEAAMITSSGQLNNNGVCCAADETVYEGDNYSYCVKKTCSSLLPNRLTVDYGKCGGAGRPFTDEIPICCPAGVTAAARCDENGVCFSYGVCCQPGSTRIFTDCSSRCMLQSCPVGQKLTKFKSNYAEQSKCCDEDAPGSAYYDSHGKGHSDGVCCEVGETAVQAEWGRCSAGPNSCSADEDLAEYYQSGTWLKMCCPKGVTGASSGFNSGPVCCQVGEKAVRGDSFSRCVPASCGAEEELVTYLYPWFSTDNPSEKCCPTGSPGAAYCNSSGVCNTAGYCCATGETIQKGKNNSVCVPNVCPSTAPNKLTYMVGGVSFDKCCPSTSKAAAYMNALSAANYGGYCCGENEIAIQVGSNTQCQACSDGMRPNDAGNQCI